MSKRISEMIELQDPSGQEEAPLALNGQWFKVRLANIAKLVTADGIGLGKVDNTADSDKPISTATAEALSKKSDTDHTHNTSDVNGLSDALLTKASKTDFNALSMRVSTLEIDGIDTSAIEARISDVETNVATNRDSILTIQETIEVIETSLSSKVSLETLTTLLASYVTKETFESSNYIKDVVFSSSAPDITGDETFWWNTDTKQLMIKYDDNGVVTWILANDSSEKITELQNLINVINDQIEGLVTTNTLTQLLSEKADNITVNEIVQDIEEIKISLNPATVVFLDPEW